MSNLEIGLIVSGFGIVLSAIVVFFRTMNAQITTLRESVIELKTQVSPLWARVQSQISSDLHHPHPRYFEMDKLLEKLEAMTISDGERARLKVLLMERSTDMHEDITEDQRKKASLMIQVMDMVLLETSEAKGEKQ
jgi:hypothetical protein